MFIKKIILEGFKSYGKRVELTGFDKSFNAITGFNGSGKSNILDAICFVLGLNKLEVARCHSLNDLIYKNGQAGVTTASVTIEIDNSDGKFSSTEYHSSTTIVVRREVNIKNQSKFFIDGFSVTKEKLLDFFQSVKLNIQNPHFLIMQGKILKVAMMKPNEILSMLEETVGVSIYENKKKQNQAKILKYDDYLKEMEEIIEQSIKPKLEQLKEEEKSLLEFREVAHEYDVCSRILIAYRYLQDKDIVNNADKIIEKKQSKIEDKKLENIESTKQHKVILKEITDMQSRLDEEVGGQLKQLENERNDQRNHLERILTTKKLKMDAIEEERSKLDGLQKSFNKETKKADQKKKEYEKLQHKLSSLDEEKEANLARVEQAQNDYKSATLGKLKSSDGQTATLTEQLRTVKDELTKVDNDLRTSKYLRETKQKLLKDNQEKIKQEQSTYDSSVRDIEIKTKEAQEIEDKLSRIEFSEERYNEVKSRLNKLKADKRLLEDKQSQLCYEVPKLKFNYNKPYAHFNENDVLGVVAELFTVKRREYMVAIERICISKLYDVIVSTHEVGRDLLKYASLKDKRTLIPLNKIEGRATNLDMLHTAERLVGKGNVVFAIQTVSYDARLEKAMRFIFGDALICPNVEMARKVAFANGIKRRTYTMEGDLIDPSGSLSGGTMFGAGCLKIITELKDVSTELERYRIEIGQIQEEYDRLSQTMKPYSEMKRKLDSKNREIEYLRQRVTESNHYVLMQEIKQLEEQLVQEDENIAQLQKERSTIMIRIKDLEDKNQNSETVYARELEEANKNLEAAQNKLTKIKDEIEKKMQAFRDLEQEIKHIEECLVNLQSQITQSEEAIELSQQEATTMESELESASAEAEKKEASYNEYRQVLTARNKELKLKQKSADSLKNLIEDNESQVKILEHEIDKVQTSIREAKTNLTNVLAKNSWIKDDEKLFNDPSSPYRVLSQNFNLQEYQTKLTALKNRKATLAKSVNMKANIMHGEKIKEFEELTRKKQIVEADKDKLQKYIQNVDREKDVELTKAWQTINNYFGLIFNSLLPNTNAKLDPIDNNLKKGLQIRVCFGQVWKESLNELSGGQRSLVALSLVLALLKYNPAPLYILDEVDAALDQSHTQNIGIMIKKHFDNSQFIIVSLKDDMFSNANVLFQTKFIDGYSTVERR